MSFDVSQSMRRALSGSNSRPGERKSRAAGRNGGLGGVGSLGRCIGDGGAERLLLLLDASASIRAAASLTFGSLDFAMAFSVAATSMAFTVVSESEFLVASTSKRPP